MLMDPHADMVQVCSVVMSPNNLRLFAMAEVNVTVIPVAVVVTPLISKEPDNRLMSDQRKYPVARSASVVP